MMEQEKKGTLYAMFASVQETFEDAKRKSNEESNKRTNYFRFAKDGAYNVRILPLAPVQDQDGNFMPLERKGYEYPLRSLMLRIEDPSKVIKGKPSVNYVSVCNVKHAFPKLESDLIEVYANTACQLYASDEKLCETLRKNSFSGGLKWDSRRCMYVVDLENPNDGIQLLQLSFAQYKDLEERKMNLWNKLVKSGRTAPCPISSIDSAYPVEIIRKTENGKASYSFNIDTVADKHVLNEDDLQRLLDTPRIPEQIYRYTRYHLEATIAFLTQLDEKYDINVMNDEAIINCIEQIKTVLPASDQSHFSIKEQANNTKKADTDSLESLWALYDTLCEANLDDYTEEGQELRASLLAFIDANQLNVKVSRKTSNEDILNAIENEMDEAKNDDNSDKHNTQHIGEEENEESDAEPAVPSYSEDDNEAGEPAPLRRERNDDNNEPAVRNARRLARAPRRR